MKNILFTIIALATVLSAGAQNVTDIVRWSHLQPSGTAASLGVQNSIGAIGGDIMSAHINPAGIGEYKKSVLMLTAGLDIRDNTSYLVADQNSKNSLKTNNFNVFNGGIVFGNYRPNKNFTSSNFAIGFTRMAVFKEKFFYEGKSTGTMTEFFAERANSLAPDQLDDFVAYPAYNTGAIFDFDGDRFYETDFAQDDLLVTKSQNVSRTGSLNELSLTWAGEYKNKVNIGVGIGIPFANFTEKKVYKETDPDSEIATFNELTYIEDLRITGRGFNAKLGVLFKPVSWLRIGGSFHSPTWFTFNDVFSTSLEYSYDDVTNVYPGDNDVKPELQFKYNITNPYRAMGSIGTVFGTGDIKGFINADLEYVDYLSAEYDGTAHSDDPSEIEYTQEVNQDVANSLKSATNFRIGGELAYDIFRLRAGYYRFHTPFARDSEANNSYSIGAGFRGDRFYMDFAIQFADSTEGYQAYSVINAERDPLVNTNVSRTFALVTFGFTL